MLCLSAAAGPARAQAGAPARAQAGAQARAQAGAQARAQAGAQARAQAGAQARAQAGAQARAQAGAQARAQAGAQARAQAGAQARAQAGAQARAQAGAQARAQAGAQTGAQVRAQAGAQAGAVEDWAPPARAEVTLVGDEGVRGPVQQVIGELLSREGVRVTWSQLDRLRLDDVLAEPAARQGQGAPVAVWIDLGSRAEARIYFRAAGGRRFVIRRVAFEGGPSAVAVEEIAQIVQSVLRALGSGTAWALSLSEARAALAERLPPPAAPPGPAPPSATVEIGSQLVGGLYAPQLPLAGRVDVSITALARRGGTGSLGGWLALGYGLPERFAGGTALGADLETTAIRAGLLWEPWRDGRWALRAGIGGGVDRVTYTPVVEMPGAAPAPSGAFYSAVGALTAALRLELGRHVALTAGALAEVSLARVHYDAYDSSGALEEVLVPYRLRPALALGAEFRP